MILNYEINAELSINSLMDLNKLKTLEETGSMKINASELARHLDVDRRTIRKYINGFEKKPTRNRSTQFDKYYVTIKSLLNHDVKIFHYKSFLYRYLIDKYGMKGAESSFRRYINSIDEFKTYFADKRKKGTKQPSIMRYETSQGQQAQLDWKEKLPIVLSNGEVVVVNIFVLILSYSRFRIYRLSITKIQDILFNFLDDAFDTLDGVPHQLLCDNMPTIMDDAHIKSNLERLITNLSNLLMIMVLRLNPVLLDDRRLRRK